MLTLTIDNTYKVYNWSGKVSIDLENAISKVNDSNKYGALRIGFGSNSGGSILSSETSLIIKEEPSISGLYFNNPGALVEILADNTLFTELTNPANFNQGANGRGDVMLNTTLKISGNGLDVSMSQSLFLPPNLPTTLYLQLDLGGPGVVNLETVGTVVVNS